jgi:hypothetical protein
VPSLLFFVLIFLGFRSCKFAYHRVCSFSQTKVGDDTIYGQSNRLESNTADNLIWARFANPTQTNAAFSRLTFRTETSTTPLRRVTELARTEAATRISGSDKTLIVLVESLYGEVGGLITESGSSISTSRWEMWVLRWWRRMLMLVYLSYKLPRIKHDCMIYWYYIFLSKSYTQLYIKKSRGLGGWLWLYQNLGRAKSRHKPKFWPGPGLQAKAGTSLLPPSSDPRDYPDDRVSIN